LKLIISIFAPYKLQQGDIMKYTPFLFVLAACVLSLFSCIPPQHEPLNICNGIPYGSKGYDCVNGMLIIRGSSSDTSSSSSDVASSSSSDISSSSSEIASSSSSYTSSSSSHDNPKCNGKEYDPVTHDCCSKTIIYAKLTQFCAIDNKVYQRCGGNEYSPAAQFCVDNKVYDKCAGSNSYDPAKQDCCNKTALYTTSTQFCSASAVYPKCNGKEYDPATQFCVSNVIYAKCGGKEYNPSTQFCADNNIHYKCNSNHIYIPSTQFCAADNKVYDKCAGNNYDPAKQSCCNNALYTISTQFCSVDNKVHDKCNGNTYIPSTHFCANNVIYAKCGGNEYSPATQFCDSNNIYAKCNSNTYNPVTQDCCSKTVYNILTQFCINNTTYAKCGGKEYNPATQFCINNVLYDNCGGKQYNPSTDYCHNNVVTKYGTLIDNRDKNNVITYKTLNIGAKTWMAENLRYRVRGGGTLCYNSCDERGILYNGDLVKATICPDGWRIPNNSDWNDFVNYAKNDAKKLRARSGWNDNNGTNDYGFSALPAGFIDGTSGITILYELGTAGNWWAFDSNELYQWKMNDKSVFRGDIREGQTKSVFNSVRCVK
jgi:uncharacterized protein (TIGR02145 family)